MTTQEKATKARPIVRQETGTIDEVVHDRKIAAALKSETAGSLAPSAKRKKSAQNRFPPETLTDENWQEIADRMARHDRLEEQIDRHLDSALERADRALEASAQMIKEFRADRLAAEQGLMRATRSLEEQTRRCEEAGINLQKTIQEGLALDKRLRMREREGIPKEGLFWNIRTNSYTYFDEVPESERRALKEYGATWNEEVGHYVLNVAPNKTDQETLYYPRKLKLEKAVHESPKVEQQPKDDSHLKMKINQSNNVSSKSWSLVSFLVWFFLLVFSGKKAFKNPKVSDNPSAMMSPPPAQVSSATKKCTVNLYSPRLAAVRYEESLKT